MKWDIKVTSKGQITLPKKARDVMMVGEGDYLVAVIKDDSLILTRKPDVGDSEQIRYYARRRLAELGYGDACSRQALDPPRLRGALPRLTVDTVRRIREGREGR
ncbi:MAG: AbrB/MazE/SpoVT family DNA-binding domain-containing protein [Firmicutes bacterium]|nr:AbrB/MazE/SpoVT family DNA-binding domain-containing protein [Bacillota bacterium]